MARMVPLKLYRDSSLGFPDLLNWGAVVADGVVLNKDGSLLAGWFYRGQDLATVSEAERNHVSSVVSGALSKLGSGWMLHQDALRKPARDYPGEAENAFPEAVSALLDAERRAQFQAEGAHYESFYGLAVSFLPPLLVHKTLSNLFFDDPGENAGSPPSASIGDQLLREFQTALHELEDRLSGVLRLMRMKGRPCTDGTGREPVQDELLRYLNTLVTGRSHPVNLPPVPMYLDAVIGAQEFWPGIVPRLGERLIQVVAIDGFPQESYPGILAALDRLPFRYRWSNRFICLDAVDAQGRLRAHRRKWQQKVRGFVDQLLHSSNPKGAIDQDAVRMVSEADTALAEVSSGLVGYGHFTSVVVLEDTDPERLSRMARQVQRVVNTLGFSARLETINTVEAFLGSLPGHANPNLRRPLLHTLNLADLLPLSAVWTGEEHAPCPFYPPDSPPLLYAATEGGTPFRFNLHVGDLGHTLVFGPTGSGKSTALALLAAQFRRYPQASVFAFDKGSSLEPLTRAVGGQHFNLAGDSDDSDLCFAPLMNLDRPGELGWAEDWLVTLLALQGVQTTPTHRNELHRALLSLQDSGAPRTLNNLQTTVQDREIKQALTEYTVSGALGHLLDAERDELSIGTWSCFEIEALMQRQDRVRLPVLLYLFHVIERQLNGQPALLVLDEAWLMLGNPVFREKIREWLKVLRKANCAVVLATQSLSDAANSGILDVLAESCPTKLFLANVEAARDENQLLYRALGCNETEIRLIAGMRPKRQYFVASSDGRRCVDFNLGPLALSFVGASSKEDLARVRALNAAHGAQWPFVWLQERGVAYAA